MFLVQCSVLKVQHLIVILHMMFCCLFNACRSGTQKKKKVKFEGRVTVGFGTFFGYD